MIINIVYVTYVGVNVEHDARNIDVMKNTLNLPLILMT